MLQEETSLMAGEDTKYDVAVIGAGPAGIMAAIQSARKGLRVVLLEKNSSPANKLLLTGGGRCNLTNAEFNLRELVKNYNNGEFLFHAFSVFGSKQVIDFFEKLGLETKIEGRKVFPKSNDSYEVREVLEKCLAENKVKIIFGAEVLGVKKTGKKITKLILSKGEIIAKNYVLATGGKSYAATGSDGAGYKLAEKLGHEITKPMPALAPIKLSGEFAKNLQGICLKDIRVNILQNSKKIFFEDGEIMFTHFGISGPVILNISGKVGELLEKGETKISIDLFPKLNQDEVLKSFEEILRKYPRQIIKNILAEFMPERLSVVLLEILKIDKNLVANNMVKADRLVIAKALKSIEFLAEGVAGFEQAMVTRGGILLKEIDHKTMRSKIISNLFFAGEIIDVDGKSGGFNLQMCWSTGYLAGQN